MIVCRDEKDPAQKITDKLWGDAEKRRIKTASGT